MLTATWRGGELVGIRGELSPEPALAEFMRFLVSEIGMPPMLLGKRLAELHITTFAELKAAILKLREGR